MAVAHDDMATNLQNKVLDWRHSHPSRGGEVQDAFSKSNHVVCVRWGALTTRTSSPPASPFDPPKLNFDPSNL